MATHKENKDLTVVDSLGNIYVLLPTTNAKGVIIDPSINTNLDIGDNTLEKVLGRLGSFSFKSALLISDIDSSAFAIGDGTEGDNIKLVKQSSVNNILTDIEKVRNDIKKLPTSSDISKIDERLTEVEKVPDIISSTGEGFSTMCMWSDGNPSNASRLYQFVTLVPSSTGKLVKIAEKGEPIFGVSMPATGIISNKTSSHITEDGDINKGSVAVTIVGPAIVKDQGVCNPGDYCLCGNNGIAYVSETGIGHYVISRNDTSTVLINFTPNIENINSLFNKIAENTSTVNSIKSEIDSLPDISGGTASPTGGKTGDVYIKYE